MNEKNLQQDLAELIFPNIKLTIEDLEKRYPPRNLPLGAEVTRFAPSPTGFLHTGSLMTVLVTRRLAKQSNGIFFVRLEDTDTKREIAGSGQLLIEELIKFNLAPDEGYFGDHEEGSYGPYRQSEREDIYKVVIKYLLATGKAYPCFCTPEELDELRNKQEKEKVITGYYGPYAKYRYFPIEEAIKYIQEGKDYVIRFRSPGNHHRFIEVQDRIRGKLSLSENDLDIVILKRDGLPTYHFAHLVDDHFMRTTLVSRGEDWLSSLALHVQLFQVLGWKAPEYAHLPNIMKLDGDSRRKLSKRKDPEAAVSYFFEKGYPIEAILEYLMILANSDYEEWRIQNPFANRNDFNIRLEKMAFDGALFDLQKVDYLSKEIISKMSAETLLNNLLNYAQEFDHELLDLINLDQAYFKRIINIEREKENPRKDYVRYSDVYELSKLFYDKFYYPSFPVDEFNPTFEKNLIQEIIQEFGKTFDFEDDEQTWFSKIKDIATRYNFALNNKEYKKNPDFYLGTVGDVAEMIRIALTGKKQTPNLYQICRCLGPGIITKRLQFTYDWLIKA